MTAFLIYICALKRVWSITNIIYYGFVVRNIIFIYALKAFSYINSHRILVIVYKYVPVYIIISLNQFFEERIYPL